MQTATVLIVDDEPETRRYLRLNLVARGYDIVEAENGIEALDQFARNEIDLILLDIRMPEVDGYQVCSEIRKTSDAPIVFVTGSAAEGDLVKAFDLGGDDYLTKPFGVAELLARVRAALRRVGPQGTPGNQSVVVSDIVIDLTGQRIWKCGREIRLTSTEFAVLALLVKNANKVLTHRFILEHVWGDSYDLEKQYVRAYLYRLRTKLEDNPQSPRHLMSIPGVGYVFSESGTGEEYVGIPGAETEASSRVAVG